jgi:hypothetical protein
VEANTQDSEPFPTWLGFAELQYVGGLGKFPGAPGAAAPHLRQAVADLSRTGWDQPGEPLSSCLYADPQRDCGPKRGKTAATPVLPPQNGAKHPRLYRSGVTVGQKRRYATRMAHNAENRPVKYGAKLDKVPQSRWCCGASDAYDPQSDPNWGHVGFQYRAEQVALGSHFLIDQQQVIADVGQIVPQRLTAPALDRTCHREQRVDGAVEIGDLATQRVDPAGE